MAAFVTKITADKRARIIATRALKKWNSLGSDTRQAESAGRYMIDRVFISQYFDVRNRELEYMRKNACGPRFAKYSHRTIRYQLTDFIDWCVLNAETEVDNGEATGT